MFSKPSVQFLTLYIGLLAVFVHSVCSMCIVLKKTKKKGHDWFAVVSKLLDVKYSRKMFRRRSKLLV